MKKSRLFYIIKNAVELFELEETDAYNRLEIKAAGNLFEHYIDPLTYKNEDGIHVIKPLSENNECFAYVCPWCQDIHFGKKENLFLEDGRLYIKCDQLKHMDLKFIIDFPVAKTDVKESEGMTGEEFLFKVRGIKNITEVCWDWEGDYFMPDVVKLSVVADGEKIEVTYPGSSSNESVKFMQFSCMALLLNKYMELVGDDFRLCFADDISKAMEYIKSKDVKQC